MINVLIMGGGVTTVWHMVKIARKFFAEEICIHLCDINDRSLVPAATMVDYFYQVPEIQDKNYYSHMLCLMSEQHIDLLVPLIDQDLFIWSCDNPDLLKRNILSTGPCLNSAQTLSNKRKLTAFLNAHDLPTPKIVAFEDIRPESMYIIKPEVGCGTQNVIQKKGSEILKALPNTIIQEKCNGNRPEVTAEIFNTQRKLAVFCRNRLATKSGVCTKMEPVCIPEIERYILKLIQSIQCPIAFCAQFLHHQGNWCLIDCNLRLGAGTAMSSAAGFQLVRAFWANLCGIEVPDEWLSSDTSIKKVLRVYEEIVVR